MNFPTDEREARLLFNLTDSLGPVRFGRLVDRFGSAAAALLAGAEAWGAVEGFGEKAESYFRAVSYTHLGFVCGCRKALRGDA